jgi:hypothetical protein
MHVEQIINFSDYFWPHCFRKTTLVKKTCSFTYWPVFPFSYSIALKGIRLKKLVNDAMIWTILTKVNRYVFSSIIYLQNFQFMSYDGLWYSLESFELFKYLILGFHESYRDSSIVIVNESDHYKPLFWFIHIHHYEPIEATLLWLLCFLETSSLHASQFGKCQIHGEASLTLVDPREVLL